MRVKVYRNIHRNAYSVVALEGPAKGRVIAHVNHARLVEVTFTVSEAGRQRVLREGRKNVHAYVCGHLSRLGGATLTDAGRETLGWLVREDRTIPAAALAFDAPAEALVPIGPSDRVIYNPRKVDRFHRVGTFSRLHPVDTAAIVWLQPKGIRAINAR